MGAEEGGKKPFRKSVAALYAMVGVFFITVIFGLCLYRKSQRREADTRFLRDILVIQEALCQYEELTDGEADPFQTVRSKRLRDQITTCSIGGHWKLERKLRGGNQAVTEFVVENPSRSIREMESFDWDMDDGNLASGKFSIRGHGVYSIEVLTTLGTKAPAKEEEQVAEDAEQVTAAEPRILNQNALDSNYVKK
ncbi:MAG: hypothetical protein LBT98_03820 [Puniceicoccales bacterium]|jgi:hypothetical protein|nr:hypothetical protein [Puniceicoccales bacterium]